MRAPLNSVTVVPNGQFKAARVGSGLPDAQGVSRHLYSSIRKISHLDFRGLTVIPVLWKSASGIRNILSTLLSVRPRHKYASTWSLCLPGINDHCPAFLSLGTYWFTVFMSILNPRHQKSKGVLYALDGRVAPYSDMNQFSQAMPVWGFPQKILFLAGRLRRMYEALLLHNTEQYFSLPPYLRRDSCKYSGISARQNSHFILRFYQIESLNTICVTH